MSEGADGVTLKTEEAVESGNDPVQRLATILKDRGISPENKTVLIQFARGRFRYRRLMAQWALAALIVQVPVLYVGGYYNAPLDGEVATLLTWVDGFLASIVGAYYGTTAWRPSS